MGIKEVILIFVLYYAIKIIIPYRVKFIYFNGKWVYISLRRIRTIITEEIYEKLSPEDKEMCKVGDIFWKESNNVIIFKVIPW